MRKWAFNPSEYELLPGDYERIAHMVGCDISHVWRWHKGKYSNPVRNEDALAAALTIIVTERENLIGLMGQLKVALAKIKANIPAK